MKTKNRFYAYFFSENKKGICDNWQECERLVRGKNVRYRGFSSRREAEEWLAAGAEYEIRQPVKLEPGIYFDAGTGRGRGVEISVTDETGKDLLDKVLPKKKLNKFHKHLVTGKDVTNNYGELLAAKYALALALKEGVKKIFGDSKLVVDFWSEGIMREKLLSLRTKKLVREVVKLRKKFENSGGIMGRISGDDNPADLGFHR